MRPRGVFPKAFDENVDANEMHLVAIVASLVRAVNGNIEVPGLRLGESGELDVERLQMGTGDLLVELLGKHVHAERELLRCGPESDLGENLVGEGTGHDERRVTGGTANLGTRISQHIGAS